MSFHSKRKDFLVTPTSIDTAPLVSPAAIARASRAVIANAMAGDFPIDPVIGADLSKSFSIINSVVKRHGLLIQRCLGDSLAASGRFEILTEVRLPITGAAHDLLTSDNSDRDLRKIKLKADSNTIAIMRRADRWGRIGQPKSKAGTRTIPFPQVVHDALTTWRPSCPSSRLNLVFPSSRGTVQNQSNIMTRYFRLMQIEAGVYVEVVKLEKGKKTVRKRAKYGLHPLRHFCASLWIEANYSAKRVQTYMGHASIVQTYDTYGYLFDLRDNDKEALKRIESRVMSGVDKPSKNAA
jgi:Phage integrase family